ncbi:RagB/SusD family nutrient uptake outer membrane protein [Flagellimonas nanhaiensis]|uniref:RagB/SusD family nutrient uptake outer membrane protein n=1 Tax=Flagellimonas nanhaiensis TaxID=2292706 RepID=A0A371JRV1_9FLAO|nr:RagB/SusD family nutrient uptake outer membrane protein [Allomuricauda nanhaiensis]RDY60193.1 RagB/SusD family nutrient uptake outer membrane protein [Allomuricauda nanhaiensis]
MKYIKYIVLTLTMVFMSCDTDEFLNPLPDSVVVEESFFQTDADVEAGIIGIYDALQGVNENTETNIGDANRGVQFEHLLTEHRTDNTRNATLEGSKSDFHRYVVDANNVESEDYYASMYEVIFRANNMFRFVELADANNQARYTAEIKFLRAYAYFKLVRLFGDVPLVTEVLLPDDKEALFTRVSTALIYDQIIQDLQEAVNVLDNTYKARASRAAAQGILAKVYMSLPTPDYAAAKSLCEDIISSGQFSLQDNFTDVFYNELNDEIIFAIQYAFGNQLESQSFSSEFTSFVRQGREDGQNIVNDNLVADFAAFGGNRGEQSFINYGSSIEVIKYLPEGSDITVSPPTYGDNARDAGNDYIALRYADVLLMHVEATIGTGTSTTDAGALQSFQMIRDRAFPETAPNSVSSVSKDELLVERRVELAFENQRWFDLLRFGVANEVLSAHSDEMGYVFTGRDLLLPIPAREINLSDGLLTQNPGY